MDGFWINPLHLSHQSHTGLAACVGRSPAPRRTVRLRPLVVPVSIRGPSPQKTRLRMTESESSSRFSAPSCSVLFYFLPKNLILPVNALFWNELKVRNCGESMLLLTTAAFLLPVTLLEPTRKARSEE